jgi:hypothetical protein
VEVMCTVRVEGNISVLFTHLGPQRVDVYEKLFGHGCPPGDSQWFVVSGRTVPVEGAQAFKFRRPLRSELLTHPELYL